MSIDVLLVDDHRVLRQGLKVLLQNESDIRVIGEAADGRSAIRLVDELSPNVVLLDISLPDISGIAVARRLLKKHPELRIVMLSMHVDSCIVDEAMRVGVRAYVLKCDAFENLVRAIRVVMSGQKCLSSGVDLPSREA